jgi:c-di-GMP-binding flagellar brake protein YcgR
VLEDISKDISAGGIRLVSQEILKRNEELSLEFVLPPQRSFNLRGQVKGVQEIELISDEGKVTMYYVEIEFLDINEEDRNFINKFVSEL